jgi:tRNA(fMet)-specific endonuclease VapC
MESKLICLDTSVLIDYFRKTKKSNSFLYKLTEQYSLFAVSIITQYEIYVGSNDDQDSFWDQFFESITVLPFDAKANEQAIRIYRELKQKSKLIEIPDLLIGATAKAHSLKLATLNERHFSRIEGLELISINQI